MRIHHQATQPKVTHKVATLLQVLIHRLKVATLLLSMPLNTLNLLLNNNKAVSVASKDVWPLSAVAAYWTPAFDRYNIIPWRLDLNWHGLSRLSRLHNHVEIGSKEFGYILYLHM